MDVTKIWREMMRYAHTNIAAKDWRRLAEFYIHVFECRLKPPQRNLSGGWLDRATGLKNTRLEGVHLVLPGHGENGPTLEIFTYQDMQLREPVMANHAGLTHLAFEVDDLENVYSKALEMGAVELGRPVEKVIDGVGTLTFVYLRDPEGNIVEIQSWQR
jgi:catechol 2,3-dioxygenase-like lactoylglutathione lyase family enzyme